MHVESAVRSTLFTLLVLLAATAYAQAPGTAEERLFDAIDEGKELVAEGVMRSQKLNLDARNSNGETALHRAVEKGMKELARALVAAGSSLRARSSNGETVLHLAALHADPDLTAMLLGAGADAKARNDDGESVLHWAALSGNALVGKLLLEKGADPNLADLKGNRPLHAAADSGSIEMVRLVLAMSTDPKAKNRAGQSAEDMATERARPDIAALLAKAAPVSERVPATTNFGTVDIDLQPKERF
jgi:ankyrin repeat protein